MSKESKRSRGNRNLVGQTFGYLTVIDQAPTRNSNYGQRYYWKCKCACGKELEVREDQLMSKTRPTQSCGCMRIEHVKEYCRTHDRKTKHGHSRERLFNIWYLMKYRCENHESPAYNRYGGRGIKVCDEWSNQDTGYETFLLWANENGYNEMLTIDRIDNDGDYCPENCRWVTMCEQQNNKSININITYNGKTQTAAEWAREIGMPYKSFMCRLYLGWDIKRALTQPKRKSPTKKSA